ncbi:hypothetical protein DR864_24240 [Runella rosea]|uniref:TonB C-terminal domain-containing protein n=1 Tax=Runella rosea TaxID=2259595 RepID=A0A344TPQ3_9BACT|nr:hypothetical protein [Runella rosea]AXE20624.1 hypothetical protein DR864_24240 [Runella rosea]
MKKILVFSLLLVSTMLYKAFSQGLATLNDPIIAASASNNIRYPIGAIRNSVYGRIYASFDIDSAGYVRNINVIYPIMNKKSMGILGFEHEIKTGLSKTPRLRNRNQGKYILPIAFVYNNIYYNSNDYPTNKLPKEYYSREYQILNEVQITARSDQHRSIRQYSNIPPPSRQIVDY